MIELPIQVDISLEEFTPEYQLGVALDFVDLELGNSVSINPTIYDTPRYEGEYTVIPLAASEVVLDTKDKRCTDDITVLKIPRYSTDNDYGTTFYIAEV